MLHLESAFLLLSLRINELNKDCIFNFLMHDPEYKLNIKKINLHL